MEEEKKQKAFFHRIIWLFAFLVMVFSTGVIYWTLYTADQNGQLDVMGFDREKMTLVPSEFVSQNITTWYWVGAGAGFILLAYAILREVPKGKKVSGIFFAVLFLGINVAINGTLASFGYVDVGLGLMPQCQLSQEGGGEFVRATHKLENSIQVYFILEDKAYRVDGYDQSTPRMYKAVWEPETLLMPWRIFIYDGTDNFRTELVYPED